MVEVVDIGLVDIGLVEGMAVVVEVVDMLGCMFEDRAVVVEGGSMVAVAVERMALVAVVEEGSTAVEEGSTVVEEGDGWLLYSGRGVGHGGHVVGNDDGRGVGNKLSRDERHACACGGCEKRQSKHQK
eukprot:m.53781 g.53781  ORF g.53781 m.53781 type:complete len:128 (+) comp7685_c0_seq2:328-711(+)